MKTAIAAKKVDWETVCEQTRQRGSELSDEDWRHLRTMSHVVILALSK